METAKITRSVTSASNLYRRALCPGSAALEAKFSEANSEWSVEGTMLHGFFMRDLPPGTLLTNEQSEALNSANFQGWDFVREFAEQNGIPEDAPFIDEHEATLQFYDKGAPLFPGHADFIRRWPKHNALVIVDAKFGFMEVDDAAENLQLASYATMNIQKPGDLAGMKAGVAIVQPRNFGPKRSQAQYDDKGLILAGAEIVRVFKESEKPNAPRNPDMKACHFCRAKTKCPEYTAKFMQLSPEREAAIVTLDNEQLVRMYEGIKFADKVKDEVRDEMKSRILMGKITGFKLGNSGTTRKVQDGVGLYRELANRFPEVEDFAVRYNRCLDVTWGKLEELFAQLSGVSEAKAKLFVREIAAPFVEETEKAKKILVDKPAKK